MASFVSIDVETANNNSASICQIGMARFENGELVETYCQLINPDSHFLSANINVHNIRPEDVKRAPKFFEIHDELHAWLSLGYVTSHTFFDRSAIYKAVVDNLCTQSSYDWIDATAIIRRTWPQYSRRGYGLGNLASDFGIEFKHHDALEDAKVSGIVLCKAIKDSQKTLFEWHQELLPKKKPKTSRAANVQVA